jgi:hypothetical protein
MFGSIKRLFFLKKTGGVSFKRVVIAIFNRIYNIPHLIYYFLPLGYSLYNRKNIEKYKNIHRGKRCFIIANGPSLNKIDFTLLKDEITIGMNRIYLMEEKKNFIPNYLTCSDVEVQLKQFKSEYDNLSIPCFFNWWTRNLFSKKDNQMFLLNRFSPDFSKELKNGFGNVTSVTYLAIQLAYYLGCSEVYLIGKDHSYNTDAKAYSDIVSDGREANHFVEGYYKPGMFWRAPDYKSEEYAYSIARKVFEADNRIIKDATVEGKLQIFEKVDFYSLFEQKTVNESSKSGR